MSVNYVNNVCIEVIFRYSCLRAFQPRSRAPAPPAAMLEVVSVEASSSIRIRVTLSVSCPSPYKEMCAYVCLWICVNVSYICALVPLVSMHGHLHVISCIQLSRSCQSYVCETAHFHTRGFTKSTFISVFMAFLYMQICSTIVFLPPPFSQSAFMLVPLRTSLVANACLRTRYCTLLRSCS